MTKRILFVATGTGIAPFDEQYVQEQVRRAGTPAPKLVGINESSIRKGHTYRIVGSNLERRRPIWLGGKDRSEESLDECYQWLSFSKSKKIRLPVMDRWKAFRNSTGKREERVLLALAPGLADDGWAPEFDVVAQGQQTVEHDVSPQGGVLD